MSCKFWQTVFSLVRGNCFEQATFHVSAKLGLAKMNAIKASSSIHHCLVS